MIYASRIAKNAALGDEDLKAALFSALDKLGYRRKVLALPPDFTRKHSHAGELTGMAFKYYGDRLTDIMPALGTHTPMTPEQIGVMFRGVPASLFRHHDWRSGIVTLGEVPGDFVKHVSEGAVSDPWPAQVDRLLTEGGHDLILSIGQVVPHEVAGMANYNKNIFVGTGGSDGINRSHYLGAVYGMERVMGRADNPVRRVLNYASDNFACALPIVYVLTVVGRSRSGNLEVRGIFIGDDIDCFNMASELSLKVNFEMVDRPMNRVVVYLDPSEFKSTWLGNKSIYRTRMAIADGGELIVLAPGVKEFGEDATIDALIRKFGYRDTPSVLKAVRDSKDLRANLGAAAHLIHGSSEGRFSITYCPGALTKAEIEGVGFRYAELHGMVRRFDPAHLKDGWNEEGGERFFYISNPAIGLWAFGGRFNR